MPLYWPHPNALVAIESFLICATTCSGLLVACRSLWALSALGWIYAPFDILVLAKLELNGGRTEYFVLCGLGVPSLRLLWGAVRNQQLYILRMYCKTSIFFKFPIVLYNHMT